MKSFYINGIGRNALLLAACSSFASGAALAADGQPSIVSTQYAGENRVAVRWQISGSNQITGVECGYEVVSEYFFQQRGEYALYARVPGGEFELVWDLRDTTDRMWYGTVPGLDANTPVELQILQKEFSSENYCENSADSIALVDVSDVDIPPSFDHAGDVVVSDFQIKHTVPSVFYATQYWAEFDVQDWAQNISDNDGDTQFLMSNKVYTAPFGLNVNNQSDVGQPTNNLSGRSARTALDVNEINYRDGLNVIQACNVAKADDVSNYNWVGACTEEVPVIVSAGPNAVGANKVPSFIMASSLVVGADYGMQERQNWVNDISAGDNATATSNLRFHTLWVTNSAIFEVAPWISYPSGSLRFKFKEGVSGKSRVYVSLADWDVNSPENIVDHFNPAVENDLSPDHSMIQFVEISVGDGNDNVRSAGARGADLNHAPVSDTDSSATAGGGGALGILSLSLLMFGFKRKR